MNRAFLVLSLAVLATVFASAWQMWVLAEPAGVVTVYPDLGFGVAKQSFQIQHEFPFWSVIAAIWSLLAYGLAYVALRDKPYPDVKGVVKDFVDGGGDERT